MKHNKSNYEIVKRINAGARNDSAQYFCGIAGYPLGNRSSKSRIYSPIAIKNSLSL